MKFNLLSDNKRIVEVAMLIGTVMSSVDAIVNNPRAKASGKPVRSACQASTPQVKRLTRRYISGLVVAGNKRTTFSECCPKSCC